MSKSKPSIPPKLRPWIEARQEFRLSHAQVQMTRELGMNPRKLGGLNNHHQEPWKAHLPQFIQKCYEARFGKRAPADVRSIEEKLRAKREKKEAKHQAKLSVKESRCSTASSHDEHPAGMIRSYAGKIRNDRPLVSR